jgi:hypothetical protein
MESPNTTKLHKREGKRDLVFPNASLVYQSTTQNEKGKEKKHERGARFTSVNN